MTKTRHLTIERLLQRDGIKVHGIRYQSRDLQQLREQFGASLVQVIPAAEDARYVHVWHPFRAVWINVPLAEFERLATQGEIEALAFGLYSRDD